MLSRCPRAILRRRAARLRASSGMHKWLEDVPVWQVVGSAFAAVTLSADLSPVAFLSDGGDKRLGISVALHGRGTVLQVDTDILDARHTLERILNGLLAVAARHAVDGQFGGHASTVNPMGEGVKAVWRSP